MAGNPYRVQPLTVAFHDGAALRAAGRANGPAPVVAAAGRARAVVVFAGGHPKNVVAAVERAGRAAAGGRRPSTADAAVLRRQFGARWVAALGLDLFGGGSAKATRGGAAPPDDLDALALDVDGVDGGADDIAAPEAADDIAAPEAAGGAAPAKDADLGDLSEFAQPRGRKRAVDADAPSGASGVRAARDALPRYTVAPYALYPTDTMADLAERLYAATGLPPWRVHLAADRPGEEPMRGYDLTIGGVGSSLNLDELFLRRGGDLVGGVSSDRRLQERRGESGGVQVVPRDETRRLEYRPGSYVARVWALDLYDALEPEATTRALGDRYSRELLYYGAVVKYWPRLTTPEGFAEAYGGRMKGGAKERAHAHERSELAMEFLEPAWGLGGQKKRAPAELVTELMLAAPQVWGGDVGTVLAAFDRVATSRDLPAAVLSLSAAAVGDLGRQTRQAPPKSGSLERRPRVVVKRHATSHSGFAAYAVERLRTQGRARGQQGPAGVVVLARDDDEAGRIGLQLNLRRGGQLLQKTTAEGGWPADARLTTEAATGRLQALAAPALEALLGEKRGRAAARSLAPRRFTAAWGWTHALTSEGFRALREETRRLEAAGFARARPGQQPASIALDWYQGVSDYPPEALGRVFSHSRAAGRDLSNLYETGLETVFARAYPGRVVRLLHRATDVRVEVAGATPREFAAIRATLDAFLAGLRARRLLHPQTLSQMNPASATRYRATARRLRKLQETDPELFDLRRYRENAPVYAVLCQGDRQPAVYTEAERRRLNDRVRRRLVRYWNFTLDGPAYYDCGGSGSSYPHLGFRAGVHPLGYCLPCCKKAPPETAGSASQQAAHRRCMAAATEGADVEEEEMGRDLSEVSAADRHVLVFGRTIPPGRLGTLPQRLVRLVDESGRDAGEGTAPSLRLFGVPQATPSVPIAGFFFSLAAILRRDPAALAERLAEAAVALEDTLGYYAGGVAAGVPAEEIAAAYREMVSGDPEPGPFSPGGAIAETWELLTGALVRELYQVAIVRFGVVVSAENVGEAGATAPTRDLALTVDVGDLAALKSGEVSAGVVVESRGETHPIIAVGRRQGATRESVRVFAADDELIQAFLELTEGAAPPPSAMVPLTAEKLRALAAKAGWDVEVLYGDLRNMYWGAVVTKGAKRVWVPVAGGVVRVDDGVPLAFSERSETDTGDLAALDAWLADAAAAGAWGRGSAKMPRPVRYLGDADASSDAVVGYVATDGLAYFHQPAPAGRSTADDPPPVVALPYAPADIDRALFDARGTAAYARGQRAVPFEVGAGARRARLRAARFRLFVAEFAAASLKESNSKVRDRLLVAIKGTRFANASSLAALRRKLTEILVGFAADVAAVRAAVEGGSSASGAAETIRRERYEFDAVTFYEIRALAADGKGGDALARLRKFMTPRVDLTDGADDLRHDPPNFYGACGGAEKEELPPPEPPCAKGRLVLPRRLFEPYLRLLLDEVAAPMQANIVLRAAASYFDPFRFTRRPYETIETFEL
jgi:hypothetical protein